MKKDWLFCIRRKVTIINKDENRDIEYTPINEDIDSQNERRLVRDLEIQDMSNFPLVIKNIKKRYPPNNGREGHLAV